MNANKNSFHVLVKANITATAIPVLDTGKNILVITIKGLHPSILAASTTSLGTPSKVAFNIRTINARLKVVFIKYQAEPAVDQSQPVHHGVQRNDDNDRCKHLAYQDQIIYLLFEVKIQA